MAIGDRLFLLLSVLISLAIVLSLFQTPQKISLRIDGSSSSNFLADRAEISIKVASDGSKQSQVADQVRQASEEILDLLRPLTLPPNRTLSTSSSAASPNNLNDTSTSTFLPPIATLSVNTFSSNSHLRQGYFGDTETYRASIAITAEFRSLLPHDSFSSGDSHNHTVVPGSGFHHLSLVLSSLAKLPRTEIDYLRWFLSPSYLSALQSSARQKAMTNALTKIADFTAPMHLRFPSVECLSFRERQSPKSFERYASPAAIRDGIRAQGTSPLMYHDELENNWEPRADRLGYKIEEGKTEAFGLEPQSLEIASAVEGEWAVVERGWVRGIWGMGF